MLILSSWRIFVEEMRKLKKIAFFFEFRSFGVSEWWGNKFGIQSDKIRLFFIYISCLGLGSPILIYLMMAFVLEHKHIFKFQKKKKTIWEL